MCAGGGGLHPGGSASGGSVSGEGVCPRGACFHGGWADPSTQSDTMGYGQRAGGTHPNGMHSCYSIFYRFFKKKKCISVNS